MNQTESFTARAQQVIPGGVNSPVRAFRNVERPPLYATSGKGAHLSFTDGRTLIDYCLSFGPLILGHAYPDVVQAIQTTAARGTSFAVTTEQEIELAEFLVEHIHAAEKVRLVNSGTEAVMTAIRLARGFTGRTKVLKFSGCYHGHVDSMLVQAGSGVAGLAAASSAGVTEHAAEETLVVPFNDADLLREIILQHGDEIAAILVEPIAANMGLVEAEAGFLDRIQHQANSCGALLIFDEVITGFRLCCGAYSNLSGHQPDITCMGKIIGGGMPTGAIAGRAEVMNHLAPDGPVYQAGTLSGNPASVAAGLATLRALKSLDPYEALNQRTRLLTEGLQSLAEENGVALSIPQIGSLFCLFFRETKPTNFDEVMQSNTGAFVDLWSRLIDEGVYLAPSPFETGFLSLAHGDAEIEQTLAAFGNALTS